MGYRSRFIFSASSVFTLDIAWFYVLVVNHKCYFFSFIYFMYPCKATLHAVCSFQWYEKESPQTFSSVWALVQLHLSPRHLTFHHSWTQLAFHMSRTPRYKLYFYIFMLFLLCQGGLSIYLTYDEFLKHDYMHILFNNIFTFKLRSYLCANDFNFSCGSFSLSFVLVSVICCSVVSAPTLLFLLLRNFVLKMFIYI